MTLQKDDDGEITAMGLFFGNKGSGASVLLVAVAHKNKQATLPAVKVYNRASPTPFNVVLSHLPIGGKIVSLCFVNKGKYIAILVELEPKVHYHLALCSASGGGEVIMKEDLKGNCSKLASSSFDSSLFSVISDRYVKVYQTDKNGGASLSQERTTHINAGIVLDNDDYLVDQCWLKTEGKLIVISTRTIFTFENCTFDQSIDFEFPAMELKNLINDKLIGDNKETGDHEGRTIHEIYLSVEYLINYLNPTGGDITKVKMPEFLKFAIEQELDENHGGVSIFGLREEAKRNIYKIIYSKLSRKIIEERDIKMSCVCKQENGFAVGFKGIGKGLSQRHDSDFQEEEGHLLDGIMLGDEEQQL